LKLRTLWDRFFSLPSSGRGEALFRVGYAVLLGFELFGLHTDLDLYFVTGGAHPTTALEGLYGRTVVHVLHGAWCLVASILLIGVWPRVVAVVNLLLAIYFFGLRGAAAPHGADWMIHSMAFCLVFMRSDRWLSVRNPWKMPNETGAVPGWPLRVAQLYYAGLYFTAGVAKLPDPAWLSGTAFSNVLQNPLLTRFDWLRSEHEGIFHCAIKVGDRVTTGQELGEMVDLLGNRLSTVTAPAAGVVLFLVTSPAENPIAEQKEQTADMDLSPEAKKQMEDMFKGLRVAFKITAPFQVVEHNAHRKEGNTLIWEYDLKTFEKMKPEDLAQGVRVRYKK